MSFEVNLKAQFNDVKGEVDWWNWKLEQANPEYFTLGGQVIAWNKFLLKSVDVSDVLIGKNGAYLKAKVSVKFEEYVSKGYKKDDSTSPKTKKSGMSASDIMALEEAYNDN